MDNAEILKDILMFALAYVAMLIAWVVILIVIAWGIYAGYQLGCEIIDWMKER